MLSDNLKTLRERKNLSKAELARMLNIPYTTYNGYETGAREPKLDQIKKIAEALNVTISDLAEWNKFDAKYNKDGQLAEEVKLFELISKAFGENAAELINDYNQLNEIGQKKASEYVSDLADQEKYIKNK